MITGKNMLRVRGLEGVLLLVVVLGACSFVGCEKRESGLKDSEVTQNAGPDSEASVQEDIQNVDQDQDTAAQQRPVQGLLEVESWPGRRDMSTFSITWLGGEETVALHEFPRAQSAEIARRSWEDGSEVEWSDTRVVVYAGRPFRALRDTRLDVVEFDPTVEPLEPEEMIDQNVVLEIKAGESIQLYQFMGDETCYLGVSEKIYVGDCPGKDFQAEADGDAGRLRLEPLEQEWWVLVGEGAERGWVQLGGSLFETRIRRMTEYE